MLHAIVFGVWFALATTKAEELDLLQLSASKSTDGGINKKAAPLSSSSGRNPSYDDKVNAIHSTWLQKSGTLKTGRASESVEVLRVFNSTLQSKSTGSFTYVSETSPVDVVKFPTTAKRFDASRDTEHDVVHVTSDDVSRPSHALDGQDVFRFTSDDAHGLSHALGHDVVQATSRTTRRDVIHVTSGDVSADSHVLRNGVVRATSHTPKQDVIRVKSDDVSALSQVPGNDVVHETSLIPRQDVIRVMLDDVSEPSHAPRNDVVHATSRTTRQDVTHVASDDVSRPSHTPRQDVVHFTSDNVSACLAKNATVEIPASGVHVIYIQGDVGHDQKTHSIMVRTKCSIRVRAPDGHLWLGR